MSVRSAPSANNQNCSELCLSLGVEKTVLEKANVTNQMTVRTNTTDDGPCEHGSRQSTIQMSATDEGPDKYDV